MFYNLCCSLFAVICLKDGISVGGTMFSVVHTDSPVLL